MGAGPVWWTQAAIPVDLIHTGGAEGTGRRLALINICDRGAKRELREGSLLELRAAARQRTNIELSTRHTNLIPRLNSLRSCVI